MAADRPLPITPIRKNMRNRLVVLQDKLLTHKRFIIETIVDQLKNISRIEHTRHRSATNFFVYLVAGLIANTWQPNQPSLHLSEKDMDLLPATIKLRIQVELTPVPRNPCLPPARANPARRPALPTEETHGLT